MVKHVKSQKGKSILKARISLTSQKTYLSVIPSSYIPKLIEVGSDKVLNLIIAAFSNVK